MINLEQVLKIHDLMIDEFGGSKGLRDRSGLESALQRPYSTFSHQELYPRPVDKAAAVLQSVVSNHPFIDGNKRTGYVLMRLLLLQSGIDLLATEEEKYQLVIAVSKGELNIDEIKSWIRTHLKPLK